MNIRDKEFARDRLLASGMTLHQASRELGITVDDFYKHLQEYQRKAKVKKLKEGKKEKKGRKEKKAA